MSGNVTFFGDVADDFDVQLNQAQDVLDRWVENTGYSKGAMVAASTTIAFMRVGQSFMDLLRLGNGVRDGGWRGVGSDALRLITVAGVAGAGVTRLSRILAVTQAAGQNTCAWVTAANALQRTGNRFFVTLEELAKAARVNLPRVIVQGSGTPELQGLIRALKQIGVPVRSVVPYSQRLESLISLVKNNGTGGVVGFAIRYGQAGTRYGHQLFATVSNGAVIIMDTDGTLYRSLAALQKTYPNAELLTEYRDAFYAIENAALVDMASAAQPMGALSQIVLELLPVKVPEQRTAPLRVSAGYRH
jgi:hypothetical protein